MSLKNISEHFQNKSDNARTVPDNKTDEIKPDFKLIEERVNSLPEEVSIGYSQDQP